MISRRSLLLAGVALPVAARTANSQCVTDTPSVDACRGGVRVTSPPGKTLDLSFMTLGTLDPRITFTRASTGTYFDSTGTMQTAATNAPRWDYDPAKLTLNGLLIEEARTNYALQSGAMSVSPWTLRASTLTAGAAQAPDGTMAGVQLAEDTSATTQHYVTANFTTIPVNAPITISVYVRNNTRRWCQLALYDQTTPANTVQMPVDLTTGAIGTVAIFGAATAVSYSVVNAGNGWSRLTLTATLSAAANTGIVHRIMLCNGQGSATYTGDGVSSIYVWGAQAEAAAFPTSYIPTTAAAVTRAQDVCSIADMSWFTSPGGSWFCEFITVNPTMVSSSRVLAQKGGTGITPIFIQVTKQVGQNDGVSVLTTNTLITNALTKAATTWAPGQAKACLNAGAVASSAGLVTGYNLLVTTGIYFMGAFTVPADTTSGYLRRVAYWPRVLSDTELQTVTR